MGRVKININKTYIDTGKGGTAKYCLSHTPHTISKRNPPESKYVLSLGTDHLTCREVGLWFFVSFRIFFSDNTRVRIYFFWSRKAQFFFSKIKHSVIWQKLWIRFFFPPPKSEYFFQQHWESEYFFRKKT